MLFKKKKEELSDQLAVYIDRGVPRYALTAGIVIDGFEGEGRMVDISTLGCSMESVTYVALKSGEKYQAKIIPDAVEKAQPFGVKLKTNWTKSGENLFSAGFSLAEGESNSQLSRYVELLRSRGVPPDYGNISPEGKK
ncbi:MAG: hypothetical protein LBI12_06060 [Treponema sp.]|jgi:hypothetical protein|nr:hypothetical protein [Treponema sp.]